MEKTIEKKYHPLKVSIQLKAALDGRSQRWLALEVKMPEFDISRKLKGKCTWKQGELSRIEKRLNFKFVNIERL